MADIERYNTRNVAQKEIYDSYMGILRISPNELNGSDVDDATQFLNVLYDEEKKERMKIILSDSDGNVLPIQFSPKAFEQVVTLQNEQSGVSFEKTVDVINMTTIVNGGKGILFVANNFQIRSTLHISPEYDDLTYKHPKVKIFSGGTPSSDNKITARGVLLYPSESPNDSNYFNDKNNLSLFSSLDSTPRYKQVDKKLLSFTKNWHDTNMPIDERITISGKVVTQPNDFQEEVPVYYTRDYILGHYDGHQMKTSVDNTTSHAWGENGQSDKGFTDYITKLSWTRIDKLIWDSLEEIIQGSIRHTKGRYDELGIDMGADGIREQLGFVGNTYKDFAPILGTEMAKGMIMYHAMPFHRYWFHRTKQALRGFIERKKAYFISQQSFENVYNDNIKDLDNAVVNFEPEEKLNIADEFEKDKAIEDEIKKITNFYLKGLINPNPMGTIGFVNSLSKNFVLCNGKELSYKNYPNISLSNDTFFKLNEKGTIQYNSETGFEIIKLDEESGLTVMKALANTSNSELVQIPNLFALYESTPRFIRGLNWTCDNNENSTTVNVYTPNDANNKTNYVKELKNTNTTSLQFNEESEYRLPKNLYDASKVHFHTFDHLIEKETHNHNMFSKIQGDTAPEYQKTLLHHYHCMNTRGGHIYHMYQWLRMAMMNYDKTCSQLKPLRSDTPIKTFNTYFDSKNIRWESEAVDYTKYCLNGVYNGGLHNNFTPIPNTALFVFNSSIFNNRGLLSPGKVAQLDSEGNVLKNKDGSIKYTFSSTPNDTHRGTWYNINHDNSDLVPEKYKEYLTNGIDGDYNNEEFFYMGADGKKHPISEAPITDNHFVEPVIDNNLPQEEQIEQQQKAEIEYCEKLINHDKEIEIRKFWAMKANEAEGYIPISYTGKAGGYIILSWSRDERRGAHSSSRNTYEDKKYNVASYIMTPCEDYDEDKSYWRCWSSIAYLNSHKLGVGDVPKYLDNKENFNEDTDYYDVHCVTQLPEEEKHRAYTFGGKNVLVNETCPTPPYMNLLPLLRI